MLGVDQAVIGVIGLAEHRKASRVLCPGKVAAIDDDAAERCAMPAHELGERVHHDIGAVLDRPQQHRRGHGVIHHKRDAVPVRHPRQRLDIADVAGRIADAFAEDGARLGRR